MLDSARMRILLLADYGFSGKFIRDQVRKYDGQTYSLSTIYKVVRDSGRSLWDYRNGLTDIAAEMAIACTQPRRNKQAS